MTSASGSASGLNNRSAGMKMIGLLRKVKLRGIQKVSWWFTFVGAAYNLIRLRRLRADAVA